MLAKRKSTKRPTQDVVTLRTMGKEADGTVCMSFGRRMLILKRGHAVDHMVEYWWRSRPVGGHRHRPRHDAQARAGMA
ncbi:hypothetical protein ACFQU2_13685 [Siccirubricoccus deserti]